MFFIIFTLRAEFLQSMTDDKWQSSLFLPVWWNMIIFCNQTCLQSWWNFFKNQRSLNIFNNVAVKSLLMSGWYLGVWSTTNQFLWSVSDQFDEPRFLPCHTDFNLLSKTSCSFISLRHTLSTWPQLQEISQKYFSVWRKKSWRKAWVIW